MLFDLLHGRLKQSPAGLLTGAEVIDVVREHGRAVVIDRALERHGPFDLAVIADGAHSTIRRRLMPEAYQRVYPWGCIWTTVKDGVGLDTGLLRQRVDGTRVMMGLLPVGNGELTLYWSVPAVDLAPEAPPISPACIERRWRCGRRRRPCSPTRSSPTTSRARPIATSRCRSGTTVRSCSSAMPRTVPARSSARAPISAWSMPGPWRARSKRARPSPTRSAGSPSARTAPVRFYRQASHLLTPFFQSRLTPLGWLRDAFMILACRLPLLRPMAGTTLAGTRSGWLSSIPLDAEGRYDLDKAPSGPASGRSAPRSDA